MTQESPGGPPEVPDEPAAPAGPPESASEPELTVVDGDDAAAAGPDGLDLEGIDALEHAGDVVEDDLAVLVRERDEYLEQLRRVQADFENFRKRAVRQQTENLERAAEQLADKLLPVLDAVDAARDHHEAEVGPLWSQLIDVLTKEGLEREDPDGAAFDPNRHEAVMHEAGDGDEPVVVEVLRAGYSWKGRVLRPAMVKVSG